MTCGAQQRTCANPECGKPFRPHARQRFCSPSCTARGKYHARLERQREVRAGTRVCACPDCRKPYHWDGLGRVKHYCSQSCAMRGRRRFGLTFNAAADGGLLGPAEPDVGMTPSQAAARKERIVLELLREGVPTTAIRERFAESGINIDAIAARNNIRLGGDANRLPYGTPVW